MLQNISLRLARNPEHPEGSPLHGYDIVAPLDPAGHLDAESWRKARDRCRVRRIRDGEPTRHGRLVHRAGGADGATWVIDYDDRTSADDEACYASTRTASSKASTCPSATTRGAADLRGHARGKGLNDEQTEIHSSF